MIIYVFKRKFKTFCEHFQQEKESTQQQNFLKASYKVLPTFLKEKIVNFVMYKTSTKNDNFLHISLEFEEQTMGKSTVQNGSLKNFPILLGNDNLLQNIPHRLC